MNSKKLFEKISKYILKNRMTRQGEKIAVALSGGPDSVFLIHTLNILKDELKISLRAVHINHNIRGEFAARDEEFCRKLCSEMNIPLDIYSFDIPAIARESGKSLEEAGHDERRRIYINLIESGKAVKIATGHTADEQAETVLIRLLTGAGEQGLSGIAPVSGGFLIRPLLETRKEDILEYLENSGIEYMVDHTNAENTTVRNRVRNVLLPLIREQFNPEVESALCKTAAVFREQNDYTGRIVNFYLDRFSFVDYNEARLDLPGVTNLAPWIMKNLLRKLIARFKGNLTNIGYVHTQELYALAEKPTGSSLILPGGLKAVREYNYLIIKKNDIVEIPAFPETELTFPGENILPEWDIKITGELVQEAPSFEGSKLSDLQSVYVDFDACQEMKFAIRTRRDGDRFIPSGMTGSKKLKDYFTDMKIPREQRHKIPLIMCGEVVLWIAGYRRSNLYRILPSTKRVLNIRIEKL
ncbi:MAG: tRNA lysidine(34) synthetase TilS [Firmicutes bacterium]|nr:tRNA lysidine(34) synthetase TilS [Bacillota bacterium]